MKNKVEIPLDIELQLLELGINILELASDLEKMLETEHLLVSSELVH